MLLTCHFVILTTKKIWMVIVSFHTCLRLLNIFFVVLWQSTIVTSIHSQTGQSTLGCVKITHAQGQSSYSFASTNVQKNNITILFYTWFEHETYCVPVLNQVQRSDVWMSIVNHWPESGQFINMEIFITPFDLHQPLIACCGSMRPSYKFSVTQRG